MPQFLKDRARQSKTSAAILLMLAEQYEREADRFTDLAARWAELALGSDNAALLDELGAFRSETTARTMDCLKLFALANGISPPDQS